MRIAIFGLGYVGVVSAGCLVRDQHEVIGVDPQSVKTDLINAGRSPIVEPDLEALIAEGVRTGRLRAIADAREAVEHAELLFVCVGTPGHANGSLDLRYVQRVCEQIGKALANTSERKTIAIRSTMLPGSMQSLVVPALEEASCRKAGVDFGLVINPEFLREGTAIYDFDHPPKTVIGASDARAAATVQELYKHLAAPMIVTDLHTAEMVKYADNSWHALKVTFANEMGRLCKSFGVDSREVMRLFCQDTKLNLSPAYLKPGFAFGGSCLPKDVRALAYQGRSRDVETPVLAAILASNQAHLDSAMTLIKDQGTRRVGLLGLSFKAGTDDLRESPVVALAEQLIGKGYELCIYDRHVKLASLMGANRDYILSVIPHIGRLLVAEPADLFERCDVIVVANAETEFGELIAKHAAGKVIIDLVGMAQAAQGPRAGSLKGYHGIAW